MQRGERGVKLATDNSKSLTKDSQERSKIYQVVEVETHVGGGSGLR